MMQKPTPYSGDCETVELIGGPLDGGRAKVFASAKSLHVEVRGGMAVYERHEVDRLQMVYVGMREPQC
jgi:hypothetical protein